MRKTTPASKKGTVSLITKLDLSGKPLAALLLLVRSHLQALELARVSAKAVLEATGATRSQAYELAKKLAGSLPKLLDELAAPPGRPAASREPSEDRTRTLLKLARAGNEYLHAHPGAVHRRGTKALYSDGYRDFVVSQCEDSPELDVEDLCDSLGLPATTVRDWLRATREGARRASDPSASEPEQREPVTTGGLPGLYLQTVLAQWPSWEGSFVAFCEHLQREHGVPLGRSSVAKILEHAGERRPSKRRGRSPDERALRESFTSFFPGAVWVGDGSELVVELEGESFRVNLELIVDAHSDAFVGLDVRAHEDSDAVIAAFDDGVDAASTPPLSLLLDNKACNHSPAVHEATKGALVVPATLGRPQNKAHVEGAFGLFSQCAPPLRVEGETLRERAGSLARLCTRLFFSAMNMRPRRSKEGRSRIELYGDGQPTREQVEVARAALQARLAKQLAARRTLRERQDPAKRAYLDEALARLQLSDPTGHVQAALARYSLGDIANGVAIFAGKHKAKTLPEGVDVRYLLGIVTNIAAKREGLAIATALWDERLAARDHVLASLRREHEGLANNGAQLLDFVDRALAAGRELECYFWLDVVADLARTQRAEQRRSIFDRVARRICTSYRVPPRRRQTAMCVLASLLLPTS